MIDRRTLGTFDWGFLVLTLTLVGLGIANLNSAAAGGAAASRQALWAGAGLVLLVPVIWVHYQTLERYAYVLYGLGLVLLVAVLGVGRASSGALRWLALGPLTVQPAEFMKMALVLALARYFCDSRAPGGPGMREVVVPLALAALPALLVVKQPDLGSGVLLLLVCAAVFFVARVPWRAWVLLTGAAAAAAPFAWMFLKGYQRQRILTFLDPSADPLGSGYHVLQSTIAVGSGGLWGKGYLAGTQAKLLFLPERHTDFVFAVVGEEWGWIGASALLGLYALWIAWGLGMARKAHDPFAALVLHGVVAVVALQVVINVGMVVGLLPVVGVPLPFFSYGGSSAVSLLLGVGLMLNVRMRRFAAT